MRKQSRNSNPARQAGWGVTRWGGVGQAGAQSQRRRVKRTSESLKCISRSPSRRSPAAGIWPDRNIERAKTRKRGMSHFKFPTLPRGVLRCGVFKSSLER